MDLGMEGAVEYSEATTELIDNEVRDIINEQFNRAREILDSKKELLEKGALILLEKEKIEGSELKELMEKEVH
jgi:cell division protease FtsH